MDKGIVHEIEGLQRRGGTAALAGADGRIGGIKNSQIGMPLGALGHEVDAALVVIIDGFEWIVLRELPFRLWREGVGAARGRIQLPAERQQGITEGLGIQPLAREGAEQVVGRVLFQRGFAAGAGLLPGFGQENAAVHRFDGPALPDEAAGQPVQQFRMRGRGLPCLPKSFGVGTRP